MGILNEYTGAEGRFLFTAAGAGFGGVLIISVRTGAGTGGGLAGSGCSETIAGCSGTTGPSETAGGCSDSSGRAGRAGLSEPAAAVRDCLNSAPPSVRNR
ncbi:MAG: hypothetical protein LBK77_08340 [Spirochaetaceae bacterium]|nr:hypothetical protein [Spirochaetaceae bacterium]